jgi:hypothetical protein
MFERLGASGSDRQSRLFEVSIIKNLVHLLDSKHLLVNPQSPIQNHASKNSTTFLAIFTGVKNNLL